ncbi:zinc ribbon domain-containing protein [Candidatus Pelagibacter sp. HIMB1506]|uniref:zinc ribbon domain-containing protein n=1 Tax=Candidatus Pelagibacter sp. HIMB1506 TaxID=3413337 RepID=UPI003F850C95
MALVKCKECNKQISDSAEKCPNCGFKKKQWSIGWKSTLFIIFILLYGIGELTKDEKSETKTKTYNSSTTTTKSTNINREGRAKLMAQYNDPGYVESSFPQDVSFWIKIKSPPTGQAAEIYAQVVCKQAKNDYNTSGFTITIWGLLDNKQYGKARCY